MSETYHIDSKTIHIVVDAPTVWKRNIRVNKSTKPEKLRYTARWNSIRRRAFKKKLLFDLTIDDIENIVNSPCEYCGSTERIEIDRKDSNLGYLKINIVPACRRCNTIKNNVVTYKEMMKIVEILGWRK